MPSESSEPERGQLEEKAVSVRRGWFNSLPIDERDNIIKPAFEAAHPTNEKIRETTKRFDNGEI